MKKLDDNISFSNGSTMKNRFMLAPLTNSQSHENGVLSEEEFHWLTLRAKGQFGLVMTCASHVQAIGKGFQGQGRDVGRHSELRRVGQGIRGGEHEKCGQCSSDCVKARRQKIT